MGHAQQLEEMRKRAQSNRDAVEEACPVPVIARTSLGALDPATGTAAMDSSDSDGRIAVGTARSLDLDALRRVSFDTEVPWFDVALLVLSDFPPPLKESSRVWVSDMGSLYHRYDDCQVMWGGKRTAHEEGMKVHGVHSRTLSDAIHGQGGFGYSLKSCKSCI